MVNTFFRITATFAVVAALDLVSFAQDCASVTLQESAASNTNLTAQVSVANCRQNTSQTFVEANVTVQSSNSGAASVAPPSPAIIGFGGQAAVQILAGQVTSCTNVNLTFTIRFKLKNNSADDDSTGPEQVKTITKTVMVCPFQFDIRVTNVSTTPSAAGQQSQVRVTIANQGAQTLFSNSYQLRLSMQDNLNGLVRNTCPAPPGNVTGQNAPSLPDIKAGETKEITADFRFPQAGQFNLVATASISGAEDGPTGNNARSQAVTVPLPRPLICEVTSLTTNPGETVTIRGNWFKRFGSNETPTVQIGDVNATVINVPSPLEMTVSMPNLRCTAAGRAAVVVTNGTGSTTFQNGPTFPGGPDITGINPALPCPGGQVTINVTGLRGDCPNPTVRLGTQLLNIVTRTANTIVVQLPQTVPAAATALTVQTDYGTDSTNLAFPAPTITDTTITNTSRVPSQPGTAENLTISLANFRPDCAFTVTLEPRTLPGGSITPGVTVTPQVLSTTASSIVVRIFAPGFIGAYTVKVQTPYGLATRGITIGPPPGPGQLLDNFAPALAPQITNVTPNPVTWGQELTIAVSHVPNRPDFDVRVDLPGNRLEILNRQPDRLVVRIPRGEAPLGNHLLRVTTSAGSDERSITIRPLPPVITSVSDNPVTRGKTLTIFTQNVPVLAELLVTVKLGNTTLECLERRDNRLRVEIPASFPIGIHTLKVITVGGSAERPITVF